MTPLPAVDEDDPKVAAYRLRKVEERLTNGARAFGAMRNWIAFALISSLGACVVVGISIGTRTERLDRLMTQIVESNLAVAKLADSVSDLKTTIAARHAKIETIEEGLTALRAAFEDYRRSARRP